MKYNKRICRVGQLVINDYIRFELASYLSLQSFYIRICSHGANNGFLVISDARRNLRFSQKIKNKKKKKKKYTII